MRDCYDAAVSPPAQHDESGSGARFHGWRLLGVVMLVVLVLAGVSALVDWIVLGNVEAGA
jgi:hypothetical protein